MGSHICQDCGAQVTAAPGVVHDCPVRERRALERRVQESIAASRLARVLVDISDERDRQEAIGLRKRGEGIDWRSCADPEMAGGDGTRYAVLGEEVGEVANAMLEGAYGSGSPAIAAEWERRLRAELVQVAAVATAWVESIDTRSEVGA